jgi:hypothetical protein
LSGDCVFRAPLHAFKEYLSMAQAIHFVFRFDALIQGDMLVEVKAVI